MVMKCGRVVFAALNFLAQIGGLQLSTVALN